jgi:dolichol-phosphate mannosyltransferase
VTLHVVLPALNEAPNIGRVVEDLRSLRDGLTGRLDVAVTVVDDGSDDGTDRVARNAAGDLRLEVRRHEHRLGPGRAFATAFRGLAGALADDDFVLTLEADNTSRLEIVDAMLHRIDEGYDVVFASPYMYGGGIVHTDPGRVFLSHMANTFVKEFLDVRGLLTVSSFFRLYRGDALKRLQAAYGPGVVERDGFECMTEVAMKLVYLRMRISEVPMVLDTGRRIGKSKMRVLDTGLGYFALFRHKAMWQKRASLPPPP